MHTAQHTPGPFRDLDSETVNISVPPMIETLMTGVSRADQDSRGNIRLHYTDGTIESAACPDLELITCDNFFTVVGTVQGRARKEGN